jgi:hypothetical protein
VLVSPAVHPQAALLPRSTDNISKRMAEILV